jgi:signal transduction histidine kinase
MLRVSLIWAVFSRGAVVIGCGGLSLLLVSGARLAAASVVVAVLIAWNLVYGRRMLRSGGGPDAGAWFVADVVISGAVLLSQHWTIPLTGVADGSGWMNAFVSMSAVTYQWHTRPLVGALATVVLVAAYMVGIETSIGGEGGFWLATALWVLVCGLLSRGLFVMVRRGGRRADEYLAAGEKVRSAAEVSHARRADERDHLAALHDTAAATLLMVGLGTVQGRPAWLADQARRDLLVLDPQTRADTGPEAVVDLGTMLTATTAGGQVTVRHPPLHTLLLPPAPAAAIRDSVREALTNVARHAAVAEARMSVRQDGSRLVVEVSDNGVGFDPDKVPAHRRGIAESITARMARAGGTGSVRSAPGQGTVVHLEWARG